MKTKKQNELKKFDRANNKNSPTYKKRVKEEAKLMAEYLKERKMEKYSFSLDDEYYYNMDSIEDMLEEEENVSSLYMGEKIEQKNKNFLNIDALIDDMKESAYELGEYTETYLDDMTEELRKDLKNTILKWFDDNGIKPNFLLVENVREISREDFLLMKKQNEKANKSN